MTYSFVGSLFFLLALNLWNAGEITYQVRKQYKTLLYLFFTLLYNNGKTTLLGIALIEFDVLLWLALMWDG